VGGYSVGRGGGAGFFLVVVVDDMVVDGGGESGIRKGGDDDVVLKKGANLMAGMGKGSGGWRERSTEDDVAVL